MSSYSLRPAYYKLLKRRNVMSADYQSIIHLFLHFHTSHFRKGILLRVIHHQYEYPLH